MPCSFPLKGYRATFLNENGKRPIVFNREQGFVDMPVEVPCGQCWSCRLEYSRQWAVRCMHEASLYTDNAFITLTYNNENLPDDHSVSKEELQKFFKRLRKHVGKPFRYFACAEYGEKNNRPHYHAIIFNYGFPDKYLHAKTKRGDLLFRSNILEKAWKKGHSLIGDVTFESAAYVARYVMKKRKGKPDQVDKYGKTNSQHYELLDKETGEIHNLTPEFCLMSRGGPKDDPNRGGIGAGWLRKYKQDTHKDFITLRGVKMALPKYYDNLLEQIDPEDMKERKRKRMEAIDKTDNTIARLGVKEKVKKAQLTTLTRDLEEQ
jgi:hypothetical protein